MKKKEIRVSKSKACEIAKKLIGTKKMDMTAGNSYCFCFTSGEVTLYVVDHCIYASDKIFRKFNVDGAWYAGPAYNCILRIGKYINEEVFYTAEEDGEMKEIGFAYKKDGM